MAYLPSSASLFTTPASVVGATARRQVWLGLVAGGAAASVTFWNAAASGAPAHPILTLQALAGTTAPMFGPFNLNASGLSIAGITSGSAIVWLR